ncbi:protein SPA1-RELATED 2-like [Macadamia integrifolia]|uniref:protein SPA1-RELATED 2-like n=1 Tax=Macadamia integrifolia TaxID=60698 RepID=UPI001C4EDDE0|nr:protein SPA1-RELATED 2-like [Macadamia integrifolia]
MMPEALSKPRVSYSSQLEGHSIHHLIDGPFACMEGAGDEVTRSDVAKGELLKRKDSNQSFKQGSSNMLESSTVFIPHRSNWSGSSLHMYRDTLCANSVDVSEPASSSTSLTNDTGVIVEELTVKNYKNPILAMVGSSNSREGRHGKDQQWQPLHHLGGGFGSESLHGDMAFRDKEPPIPSVRDEVRSMFAHEIWVQKPSPFKQSNQDHAEISKQLTSTNKDTTSSNALSPGGVRSKVLSASGFSQFFLKKTLKGKGVLCGHPGAQDGTDVAVTGKYNGKAACITEVASDASLDVSATKEDPPSQTAAGIGPNVIHGEVSLREWLKPWSRKINKIETMHLFRQIVELVDLSHSQGVALPDIRPSCFMLLPSGRVKYIGLLAQRLECTIDQNISYLDHHFSRKRPFGLGMHGQNSECTKQQKFSERMMSVRQQPQFPARSGLKSVTVEEGNIKNRGVQETGYGCMDRYKNTECNTLSKYEAPVISNTTRQLMTSVHVQLEEKWYASPEELNDRRYTLSSNIYNLGVLLFELLSCFESWEVHAAVMSDLHHRILPSSFLSENPKEAGFCLWLLHPESSSRPTAREILQSDLICESRELSCGGDLPSSLEEDDTESELLLNFLVSLNEQKQKQESKLVEDIGCLEADVYEVEKRHLSRTTGVLSQTLKGSSSTRESVFLEHRLRSDALSRLSSTSNKNEEMLMKNISQLENAYFSMRSQVRLLDTDATTRSDKDLLKNRERWVPSQNENEGQSLNQSNDCLGAFFDGLCKYARYSKFEVCGTLRNGDLLNSANVICSLSFDRDEDYFAAAGVSKKIKIFEFSALLNDSVDIHYPVIEMSSKSKLSCVCWNSYIKNYLASTDYEGVVQLWDASTGQDFSQFVDHEKRAWSVDFSQLDPTKLASGSDDCSVKIWNMNERNCIDTIRNVANVCCVQFSAHSAHLLAFGSADYMTYCYDLRNTRIPWCTLSGHGKAVSYVKFLDPETLVSASTDNSLKLWDLKKTSSSGLSTTACSLTFGGHTNEKNFVGLTVSDGYIACGSESNEVYAYYRSLPMPLTSHKFGSIDPITGKETGDDNGQFVSSVCWRRKSNMVVAANSSGSIKLLQMV